MLAVGGAVARGEGVRTMTGAAGTDGEGVGGMVNERRGRSVALAAIGGVAVRWAGSVAARWAGGMAVAVGDAREAAAACAGGAGANTLVVVRVGGPTVTIGLLERRWIVRRGGTPGEMSAILSVRCRGTPAVGAPPVRTRTTV